MYIINKRGITFSHSNTIKKIQKIETETEMAARLYEILKLGKSFEECMRVVRESVDETSAISHLMEKY